jgi:TonB family protein
VWPGEAVGVEFKLPLASEPVQAKAMVRHQGPLRCGLQFLGMSPSQEGSLHSWAQAAASQVGGHPGPHLVWDGSATKPLAEVGQIASRPWFLRRSIWLWLAGAVIVASAALGWWRWRQVWIELEQKVSEGTSVRLPRVRVPSSVMERNLLHRVDPVYPDDALRAKRQGLVVLDGVIGSDGAVKELHSVSGSDVLARAAIDAVKWWRFQPYVVNGKPTEVETTIEIDFRLNP